LDDHGGVHELVTVMVPAHNEAGFLSDCLASIRAQDYPALQIVVVDSASTDSTADIVRKHQQEDDRIELVQVDRTGIPRALNSGLARARGKWLVRVDAHSTVPRHYVSTAVCRLREGCWGGVGGRKDGVGRTPAGRAIAVAMSSRLGVGNSTYHFGTSVQEVDHLPFGAYPVDVVRELGGWDQNLVANEDFEFDYRLRRSGRALLFDPDLVIAWHCRQSIPELFRQYRRYGRGKVDVAVLHPDSMGPRHVAPPLFIGYLAVALVVGTRRPAWASAMLAPYAAAVAAESVRLAPRLDRAAEQLRVPAAIAAMHVGWGLGFWSGVGGLARKTRPSGSPAT
jgi:cellulose synthase/poly-beta-1,6-N-acetylglucosamine synthase-like glycosyltransferase